MKPVYFIQFVFPNGRLRDEHVDMPDEVAALAEELRREGWSFEIECFPNTQLVHADCCDEEAPIADETCKNGPEVPAMVERLVRAAHAEWVKRGRPKAQGGRLEELNRQMESEWG